MIRIEFFSKIFALILAIGLISSAAKAQDMGAGHKIVFQLTNDEFSSQQALTNQLKNLTEAWPEASFEVVVHSAGINYLQQSKTDFAAEIEALGKLGVEFKACENTLKSKNISKEEILKSAGFVPMGIGEVVLKQEAGWSYIKAGK